MPKIKSCAFCVDGQGAYYVIVKTVGLERRTCPLPHGPKVKKPDLCGSEMKKPDLSTADEQNLLRGAGAKNDTI